MDPALVVLAWAYEEILSQVSGGVKYRIGGGIEARGGRFQLELM